MTKKYNQELHVKSLICSGFMLGFEGKEDENLMSPIG
jgi:hypothetical protein